MLNEKEGNAVSFIVRSTEFYIPLSKAIDNESEIKNSRRNLIIQKVSFFGYEKA